MPNNLSFSINEQPTIGAPPIGLDHPPDVFGKDWPASLLDIQQRTRKLTEFGGFVVADLRITREELTRWQQEVMVKITEWMEAETAERRADVGSIQKDIQSHGDRITGLHARLNHLESKLDLIYSDIVNQSMIQNAAIHSVESTLLTHLNHLHAISELWWWQRLWAWLKTQWQ